MRPPWDRSEPELTRKFEISGIPGAGDGGEGGAAVFRVYNILITFSLNEASLARSSDQLIAIYGLLMPGAETSPGTADLKVSVARRGVTGY